MRLTKEDIEKIQHLVPGIISIYKIIGTTLEPLYISKETAELSGMTLSEYKKYIGTDAARIVLPEDMEIVSNSIISIVGEDKDADVVYRIYNKNSKYIWIHANARFIGTLNDSPVIIATFFNTSLETNAHANLLNNTKNSVYVIDENSWEMLYANDFALKHWNKSDFIGQHCFKFINDQNEQCPWCALRMMKGDSIHIDETYLPNRDKWFTIDCRKITWYGRHAIALYSTDITEAKKAQLSLVESNENLKATINNIPVGICVFKKHGDEITCIAANPYLARTKGVINCIPGKNIDESFFTKIYRNETEYFKEKFYSIFENGYNVFDFRTISGHTTEKDGTVAPAYVWLHLEGYATTQPDGSQLAYMCFTNITQEKEAEQEANRLRKLEEEQYTHTIDGIIAALPKTVGTAHLDLTQNIYSSCHTLIRNNESSPLEFGSVDYLLNFIGEIIQNEPSKKEFFEKFNRKNLLSIFQKGQNYLSLDYQYLTEQKELRWATVNISMARNPKNGDLEAVIYAVDSEDRIILDLVNKHILLQDYDNIALIDKERDTIRFLSLNEKETTPHLTENYDEDIKKAFPLVTPKEELDILNHINLQSVVNELKTKEFFIASFTVVTSDKKRLRKQLRYSYLDQAKRLILLTRTDITQSTIIEAEQKSKLEKALATAEKANEMKSVFLSTVSHDMRTPLNGIIGYTTLALQQNNQEASLQLSQTHSYLEKIKTASNALLLLINDTLDLARIENGNEVLKLEVVHTTEFIDAIITTVKPSMDAKHINFMTEVSKAGDEYIKCDKVRMEKVLMNLLSNAAKFTPENGTITLSIGCTKDTKMLHCRIAVKDTGCGMSKNFIPKAFEPFTQERSAETANIGGSGLGLSIVKRLVDLMGGHIEVDSTLGKGTSFYVFIDFEIVSSEQAHPEVPKETFSDVSLNGKHVLLCEDNAVNREIATALLEGEGVIVTSAMNGKEGLDAFANSAPGTFDAVLMDIRMPIMNGYDASEEIRALRRSDASLIPIIAMTADAYDDDVKHCFDCGMNAHIAKPIDAQKLFITLKKFCS